MTVRELLARVGADELAEWQATYRMEPWGEARADAQSGMVCASVYNAQRARDGDRVFGPADFPISFGPKEPASAEEMAAKLKAHVMQTGGTIIGA